MAVSREDVLHVARLARLRLDRDEVQRFTVQLNAILDHVEELGAVGTEGGSVDARVTEWSAPLRDEGAPPDALARPPAALAPDWQDGFFTVPRLAALDAGGADARPAPGGGSRAAGRTDDSSSEAR